MRFRDITRIRIGYIPMIYDLRYFPIELLRKLLVSGEICP